VEAETAGTGTSIRYSARPTCADAWLASRGWVVLRFLYEQVTEQPEWVAERVLQTLLSGGTNRDDACRRRSTAPFHPPHRHVASYQDGSLPKRPDPGRFGNS
jgi:hypothetical protein